MKSQDVFTTYSVYTVKIYNLRLTIVKNLLIYLSLLLVFALGGWMKSHNNLLTSIPFSRAFYDRQGQLLRLTLAADDKYRLYTPLHRIPDMLKNAVFLKEDRFYYYHPGVNPAALIRAFTDTYLDKEGKSGGSTITMQVARLYYHLNTKDIPGKINQIFKALVLELFYTKAHLLSVYLNIAPCGGNIEGFPAAALVYFGKPLSALSFSELLLLAVLPQDPGARTPVPGGANTALLAARQRLFRAWKTEYPGTVVLDPDPALQPAFQKALPFRTPHFTESLLKWDIKEYSVDTTINPDIQNLVERHTALYLEQMKRQGVNNAVVQILDYQTMELLAALGSADFFKDAIQGQVNGMEAYRSPGSTLKPFIYARAIDMGLIHPKTMLSDAPSSFGEYTPDNFRNDFKGPVLADQALVSSRNIPAIELASRISAPDLYDILKLTGIPLKPREHYGLSLVLGSAEVRMYDLVMLYASLAKQGVVYPVRELLHQPPSVPVNRLFSPEACFLVLNMLKENPVPAKNLRNFSLHKDEPVAYKTGTSIGFKDCWSVGIFDNLVIAVWLGNFNGYGNPAFVGRYTATPLMFALIDSLRKNGYSTRVPALYSPAGLNVTKVEVCALSGRIKGEYCPHTTETLFIPGKSPIERCRIHRLIYIDPETGFRTEAGTPGAQPEVWEVWPSDLLVLFKEAGLPRKVLPPFTPGTGLDHSTATGFAPKILSPRANTQYMLRLSETGNKAVPLQAVADGDIKLLYWFVNKAFLGSSLPDESLLWYPQAGEYTITVVDERGRKDSRAVRVSSEL